MTSFAIAPRLLPRIFILFTIGMMMHLAGTWMLPLIDRDETYYSEVSREMNERGDYIVPYFNGSIWLEKPPLLYWGQCVSYRIFGENDFAVRFPGVLASVLTALVVFGFCRRLYDERTAWRASLAFTASIEMLIFGKAGITDTPAVLFTTLAAWAGWEMLNPAQLEKPRPRAGWWGIFYVSLAGAFLAKGPLAALPVFGVLVHWRWARVPGFFRIMKFVRGFAVTGAIISLWLVPVILKSEGKLYEIFIKQQIVQRSLEVSQGHGASSTLGYIALLPLYFVLALVMFFPWSVWFGRAWKRLRGERSAADTYLTSGILVTFVLFSIVRTKLPHYTLPAYPLLACLIAPFIPHERLFRCVAGMFALNFAAVFGVFPFVSGMCVGKQLAASGVLRPEMKFATVEYQEPSLIWYLRGHVRSMKVLLQSADVPAYMRENGPRFCVIPTPLLAGIAKDPEWQVVTVKGLNFSKGKFIEMSMLVKAR